MKTEIINTTPNCEIVSSRIFDTEPERLFRAWSDPNHLKNWWGPKGFTNTFNEFDFIVGGKWRFIMHGPDKGNYINAVSYTHLDVYKRQVKLVEIINKLPNIETVEREDTGIAVIQLVETSKLEISHETANNWFDEIRDF